MLRDEAHFHVTRALLHRAAMGDAPWEAAMKAVSDACGATSANLVGVEGGMLQFFWANDLDPAMMEELGPVLHDARLNPRLKAAGAAEAFRKVEGIDFGSDQMTRRFPIYGEVCRRYDMGFGVLMNLEATTTGMVGMALLRGSRKAHGDRDDDRALDALAPALCEAVRLRRMVEHQGSLMALHALESVHAAALLCDRWGRVRFLTGAAEDLVGPTGPLILKAGRLTCADLDQARLMTRAVMEASCRPERPGATLTLRTSGTPGDVLLVDVAPLPRMQGAIGFAPSAIVTVRRRRPPACARVIAEVLGLTMAEADVARRLSVGEPRAAIADARGVSVETIRTQLKLIFTKLGVSREAELIVRVCDVV